ncbi:hypothetical protein Tco_0348010 [Tanacetum coccineum]
MSCTLYMIAAMIPDPPPISCHATCHHLSGASRHNHYSGTVTGATTEPPVTSGQHNILIIQEASRSLEDLELIQEEDTHPSENTSSHHDERNKAISEPQSDIIPIHRSTRKRHALDQMCLNIKADEYELEDLNEPANYKFALLDPESDK